MKTINIVGNLQLDVLASPINELPIPGGDSLVDRIDLRIAGAAGNASLTLHGLGVKHRLFSMIGDDLLGRWLFQDLEKIDLAKDLLVIPGGVTGISIAVESETRERAFYTMNGVLERVDEYMYSGASANADYVLFTGYFSMPGMFKGGAEALLTNVQKRDGISFFDTGWDPDNWKKGARDEILRLASFADYFLPNETEAVALTGISDPIEAARALSSIPRMGLIVKLSSKGIFYRDRSGNEITVSTTTAKVIDSTGAGDSFASGLMFLLSQGKTIEESLKFATKLSTTIVARPSANRYPKLSEVN